MSVTKNSLVKGKVSGVTKFGAFVKLENGQEGLVHISEVADTYIKNIGDFLKVGDEVTVKVLGQNKLGKFDLSLKKALAAASPVPEVGKLVEEKAEVIEPEGDDYRFKNKKKSLIEDPFEAKISAFLKKSEEKLLDLKRNVQEKQGYKKRKRS